MVEGKKPGALRARSAKMDCALDGGRTEACPSCIFAQFAAETVLERRFLAFLPNNKCLGGFRHAIITVAWSNAPLSEGRNDLQHSKSPHLYSQQQ